MQVKLTLGSIAGGKLSEAFEDALNRVNLSFDDKDLDGSDREITIKIKFRKEGEGFVKTTHAVETKLPVLKVTGMAWQKEEGLFTESLCIDDRQMNLSTDNVTPLGRGGRKKE